MELGALLNTQDKGLGVLLINANIPTKPKDHQKLSKGLRKGPLKMRQVITAGNSILLVFPRLFKLGVELISNIGLSSGVALHRPC